MKKFFILAVALSVASSVAFSAPKKETKAAAVASAAHEEARAVTSGNPVSPNEGSDSCGIGWQVTNKRTFLGTTTRGTTNSFVPPTFGMTSGTIGCQSHTFAKNEESAVKYAATNFDELKVEMAEGQGEYLQAFARTLGCSEAASAEFGAMTQVKFEAITKGGSLDFYENVKKEIKNSPALSANCGV